MLQDSYYKEVHVDLPALVADMSTAAEWAAWSRIDFPVSHTMATIHPGSRSYKRPMRFRRKRCYSTALTDQRLSVKSPHRLFRRSNSRNGDASAEAVALVPRTMLWSVPWRLGGDTLADEGWTCAQPPECRTVCIVELLPPPEVPALRPADRGGHRHVCCD